MLMVQSKLYAIVRFTFIMHLNLDRAVGNSV